MDDHPSLLRGLELLLPREGFRVTGTAETAAEGSRIIAGRRPQVAVLDIALGDGSGTALGRRVASLSDATATVLYTGCGDPAILAEALGSGALGVVQKTSPIDYLARAIRAAAAGRTFVDPCIAELVAATSARKPKGISPRETQVLGLIAEGLTADEAADRLGLSTETINTHVRNACRKLGARGRLHAVVIALRQGDLELSGLTRLETSTSTTAKSE